MSRHSCLDSLNALQKMNNVITQYTIKFTINFKISRGARKVSFFFSHDFEISNKIYITYQQYIDSYGLTHLVFYMLILILLITCDKLSSILYFIVIYIIQYLRNKLTFNIKVFLHIYRGILIHNSQLRTYIKLVFCRIYEIF